MQKFRFALPLVLMVSALFMAACAGAPAAQPSQTNTPPPSPTVAPPPTPTPVPPTPTPTEEPVPSGLSQEELDALQVELNASIEQWRQAGPSSYTFQFRVNCFCPTEITSPVTITVSDTNTIESIIYVESGGPVTEHLDVYLTVGGMFDTIQEAIDSSVARLTVSYDPELGYPTEVFIDRDFLIADEERGFVVTELEPVGTPTLEEIQARLSASRALWESSGPADYQMQYSRICFCPTDLTAPVVVSVREGAIESVTYAATGEPVGEAFRDLLPDVSGMFDIIQDAVDQEAERIKVSYDLTLGYPVNISIDYSALIADEEVGFEVSRLQ